MKLAILVYGNDFEPEKSILKEKCDTIQAQLDQLKTDDDAESIFFLTDGTHSIAELQQWLLEQTVSKKYVWVTKDTELPDNFLILRLNRIKNGAKTEELIELGVYTK